MQEHENHSLVLLDGEVTVTSAAELKARLLEGLATGKELRLDLENAVEIDATVMQLLWAAGRDAGLTGAGIVIRMSESAAAAARDAGFGRFPGEPLEG